jgi:hypothetical protein
VTPLTPAQCRAGLIKAAEDGLIDGSEINLMWFQGLQQAVRRSAPRNPKGKEKKNSKDSKSKTKEDKAPQPKKSSPVVTGFVKIMTKLRLINPITNESSVKDLMDFLRSNAAASIRTRFLNEGWVDPQNDYKSSLAPGDYQTLYKGWDLTEDEAKAARTYFPYLGKEKTVEPEAFWRAGAAGAAASTARS